MINTQLNIPSWHWAVLVTWFAFLIIADIAIFHRKDHIPSLKSASLQSLIWIGLGVGLGFWFWLLYGAEAGGQYFSGYVIEKSLSIDNVFAWSVILSYFSIPKKYEHRVLFWGIFGALVMRAIFIFVGIAVIERFEPILLFFGALLFYSGIKLMASKQGHQFDPSVSRALRLLKKMVPVSHALDGHKLFSYENGKRVATLLFVALLAVEFTDAIFAVDSVPAILAISREPLVVFASNAAAILGMRSLYFVFDKVKQRFWLLNKALGLLLLGIGIKMFISPHKIFNVQWFGIELPTVLSVGAIGIFLTAVIGLSLLLKPQQTT